MEKITSKIVICVLLGFLIGVFVLARQADPNYFKELGFSCSLPVFTSIIALIDGFNPCTMWLVTFLLGLLFSVSNSRRKIFLVGMIFLFVTGLSYLLYMAAWLNLFRFVGFVNPLRIAIAVLAIGAGLINCKEFFAFRKGVTLMIQERHKLPLMKKIEKVKSIIQHGTFPALLLSSVVLAAFASLIELPCTAGWPIIFTNVLSQKTLPGGFSYYFYLLLYNVVYIIPLAIVILLFGCFFHGKQIKRRQMQVIKLVGGIAMIVLGIILLVNPGLLTLVQ